MSVYISFDVSDSAQSIDFFALLCIFKKNDDLSSALCKACINAVTFFYAVLLTSI
jgi:predicted lactoylglutathione lyase